MKKAKTDKLLKGIVGAGFAITSLTACSTNSPGSMPIEPAHDRQVSQPVRTDQDGQVSQSAGLPSPHEADCDTWQWDDENEVYQCIEENSQHYRQYYSGGSWFPTIAAFMAGQALGRSSSQTGSKQVREKALSGSSQKRVEDNKRTTDSTVHRSNTNKMSPSSQTTKSRSGMGSGGSFGG